MSDLDCDRPGYHSRAIPRSLGNGITAKAGVRTHHYGGGTEVVLTVTVQAEVRVTGPIADEVISAYSHPYDRAYLADEGLQQVLDAVEPLVRERVRPLDLPASLTVDAPADVEVAR